MENIKRLQAKILELKVKHEKIETGLKDGLIKNFFIPGGTQVSGLSSVMDNYLNELFILEKELKDAYIKEFVPISNSIADSTIDVPLIDYNIPFEFVEYSGMNSIQPTREDKIYFKFLSQQFNAFQRLESIILTERGFFNQADVVLNKGTAPYRRTIKNCKLNLKFFNIIDGKGNVTAFGKSLKEIFNKVINAEEKMALEIDGNVSLHRLIGLFFNNIERGKEKDWLVNFDKVDKLETNLELLRDTFEKFCNRRDYHR
jgi:hypothetical protein